MGQQNKRSSLTLAVDTFDSIMPIDTSTRNVNRKSNSTPTPVNAMERRRSKSSVPALQEIKNMKEAGVEQGTRGNMKGRRPRKDQPLPVLTQVQEGEADQTNDDSPQSPKKNKAIVFTKIFKKSSTKASSPTTTKPIVEEIVIPTFVQPTTTASGKKVKLTGHYVHSKSRPTISQSNQYQAVDRLRSKSSPVLYSNETSMVVGGYVHKRAQTDPIPEIFLTLTPPTEEPTLTKNKYSSPHFTVIDESYDLSPSASSKSLNEEPYVIVIDDYTTYMEMPLTKKNGIIIRKKKEKLKEMVQVYYLQKDELVNRTRREIAKSKRRR